MLWNNPNVKSGVEKVKGAIGKPEDIAAAICFLASPEARFITGTTLVVDGGRLDILLEEHRYGTVHVRHRNREQLSHDRVERQDDPAGRDGEDEALRVLAGGFSASVEELGIEYLRYGPPYYSTHTGPGQVRLELCGRDVRMRCSSRSHPDRRISATSACRTGSAIFRIADWPKLFAEYAERFRRALSLGALLHAGE